MKLIKTIVLSSIIIVLVGSISMGTDSIERKIVLYDPEEIQPYVSYLKNNAKPPVKYIMELFGSYDLIVLSERTHPETTQWDLIYELTCDSRFIENVGHIFTEYGSVVQQHALEQFMNTSDLEERQIERKSIGLLRNFPIWPTGWTNNNIFNYLKKLYQLNQSLSVGKKIKLYFSDVPWTWRGKTKADFDLYWKTTVANRDQIMADRVEAKFREILKSGSKRRKALVIMNTRHAYKIGDKNTGTYLFEKFPGKVANVMLNKIAVDFADTKRDYDQRPKRFLVQNGKWDTAFWMLGNSPSGFNFKGSPFGKDQFDLHSRYTQFKYEDVFTGMIFYQPLDKHMIENNIPGYFDDEFKQVVLQRAKLKDEAYYNHVTKILAADPNQWNKRREHKFTLEFKIRK